MTMLRNVLALALGAATLPLGACAAIPPAVPDAAQPTRGWPEGSAVALGQPVMVGDLVVTPMKVVEDSRCPINAKCVWAGRLIVETRIDGAGWRDTGNITLGETFGTHDKVVALISGEPGQMAGQPTDPAAYRFAYEAR